MDYYQQEDDIIYEVRDDNPEQMKNASQFIESLEKKLINPLKYFENCSYKDILKIKSFWQNQKECTNEVKLNFRDYKIFNKDIDILLNVDNQSNIQNKQPDFSEIQESSENSLEESQENDNSSENQNLNSLNDISEEDQEIDEEQPNKQEDDNNTTTDLPIQPQIEGEIFLTVQNNKEADEEQEKENSEIQQMSISNEDHQQSATIEEINKEEYFDKTNLDENQNLWQNEMSLPANFQGYEQNVDLNEQTLEQIEKFDQNGQIKKQLSYVCATINRWKLSCILNQQPDRFQDLNQFYINHIYCNEFLSKLYEFDLKDIFEHILNVFLEIYLKEEENIKNHEKPYVNFIPKDLYFKKQKLNSFKQFFLSQLESLTKEIIKDIEKSSYSDEVFRIFLFIKSIEFEIELYHKYLPSYLAKQSIQNQIYDNQDSKVQLLMGETGSGKSTQVPQMLYALNNLYLQSKYLTNKSSQNVILCVQPRRLACITLCQRVKMEMQDYGHQVGFYIGNLSTQQKFQNAQIIFVTEQVFINQFIKFQNKQKSLLDQCSHVIIDEVHERNLKTDIIIGLIHQFLANSNKNQKQINFLLSSATINKESFEKYFQNYNLKIIEIKGRSYQVEVEYLESTNQNKSMKDKILDKLENIIDLNNKQSYINTNLQGHILIFLQDQLEINTIKDDAQNLLSSKKTLNKNYEIMELHGKLSQSEIQRVFEEKERVTKIIFSTNIAEASITIEGVSIVLDSGQEKTMIFDPIRNTNVLTTQDISKSQAEQRKGRAGRTTHGICYRLYTEKQYQDFKNDKQPEIMRSNLGFMILKIIEIGVQDINQFEFLTKPGQSLIQNSINTLQELGAIEKNGDICKLTDIGKCIIQTDLEPTIARIFIKALYLGVLDEVVKAMAVYTEYNNIFPNSKMSRDLMKAILYDYEQPTEKKEEQNNNQINQYNSDFVFMWITFNFLSKQKKKYQERKQHAIQNINFVFKKVDDYYKEAMQSINNLFNFLKKYASFPKNQINMEIAQIAKNLKDPSKAIQMKNQQKYENIVQAFFSGFSSQLAVYTGIHKLGFQNIKTNVLFYVHPSSSLNSQTQIKQANRVFQKGQILFFSVLEEREVNNYARFVSFLNLDWIKDQQVNQLLQDKSNFQPYIKLNGERPMLDYFSRNHFLNIEQQLGKMELPKKAKYCVLFQKELGCIRFFCNLEMQPYMDSLNINQLFQESRDQYLKEQQEEQITIRYKDSINYALIKNGLTIQELILPHQFLRVTLTDIPFKTNQQNILNLLYQIQDKKQKEFSEFKISRDYINQTSVAIFFFKNTKSAFAFYQALTNLNRIQIAKTLQAEDNELPNIVPQPECSYYIEKMKNLSKSVIRTQWSICESLRFGYMYFSNEVDALATYDQLKKANQFKVKYTIKEDATNGILIHILSLDKLDILTDEVEIESYVINNYQGFMSCEIKREQMDLSILHNLGLEENNQRRFLINLIGDTINQFSYLNTKQPSKNQKLQKGQQKQQEAKDNIQIKLRINNGICKAEIMLDSLLQAQELVNKFDGTPFGCQKLRMRIQNQQKFLVLGSVYQFYYENIRQYIEEAGQAVQVIAPKYNNIIFLSKLVEITTQQVYSNSTMIFQKLNFQINNLIKPDFIYFDCFPSDIEELMNQQDDLVKNLQIQFNCIIKQSEKRSSQIRVWFKKEKTEKQLINAKMEIKKSLEEHILYQVKFKKQNYHFKSVEDYFQTLLKKKQIQNFEVDNKNYIIKVKRSFVLTIQQEINNPNKKYLNKQKQKADQDDFEEEEACLICLEIKNLQRFSCGCLFCKECIQNFFLTQTQEFQSTKPLACPNHQDQPASIKLIASIFDPQQFQELIQLRIDHSVESMIDQISQKQNYIRCPSVNCNQFFQRIYFQEQKSEELLSDAFNSTNSETLEEIPMQKLSSKTNEQLFQNVENWGIAPNRVKCYGCFQEYCLISSGKYLETPEKQIHSTHKESTCEEYFKQLQLDQENLKGIEFITCPKCNFKATKGEGCNHISCKCGAHYCAKCFKNFKTSKEVYLHLDEEHQGYYN